MAINESLLQQIEIDRQKKSIKEEFQKSQEALKVTHQAYSDAVKGVPTRAPLPTNVMGSTRSLIHIPSQPRNGYWCDLGFSCRSYDQERDAYNNAVQAERQRQADIEAIRTAFDSGKEAERQRIEREERTIQEKRQDAQLRLDNLRRAEKD